MKWSALYLFLLIGMPVHAAPDSPPPTIGELDTIPYPFDALVKRLNTNHLNPDTQDATLVATALIPDGRSLQKKKADFDDPRVVAALNTESFFARDQGSISPLFIGYAAKADQLEVIQWNKSTRQFDFLIVEDYAAGKTPRVVPANRTLCLSCHQAGGPIFSQGPWSEIAGENKVMISLLQKKYGSQYKGIEIAAIPNSSFVIHFQTLDANKLLQANQVCATACKGELNCERALLTTALLGQRRYKKETSAALRSMLDPSLTNVWPENGFAYRSGTLPNRDPLKTPKEGGTIVQYKIKDLAAFRADQAEAGNKVPNDLVSADPTFNGNILILDESRQGTLPGVLKTEVPMSSSQSLGDPLRPRPKVGSIPRSSAGDYIFANIDKCVDVDEVSKAKLAAVPVSEILQAVRSGRLDAAFPSWQKNFNRAVNTLLGVQQSPGLAQPNCPDSTAEIAPLSIGSISSVETVSERIKKDVLGPRNQDPYSHFKNYCVKCHSSEVPDMALPIHNAKEMKAFRSSEGESILDKLYDGSMPQGKEDWSTDQRRKWSDDLKDLVIGLGGDPSLIK